MKKLLLGIGIISIFSLSFTNAQSINIDQCDLVAPTSCFSKKAGSNIQSYTGGAHCSNNGKSIKIEEQKVIDFLVADKKTGFKKSTETPVSSLQTFLKDHKYVSGFIGKENYHYCTEKSFTDGKYGNCTEKAFNKYLEKSCEEKGVKIGIQTTIIDSETNETLPNASVTNDLNNTVWTSDANGLVTISEIFAKAKLSFMYDQGYKTNTIIAIDTTDKTKLTPDGTQLVLEAEDSPNSPTKTVDEANECLVGNEDKLKKSTKEEHYPTALKKYQQWRANQKPSFCECEKIGKKRNEIGGCFGGQIFKWQEDQLRPKFQTGANWQDREYKGDASDITYWLQKFGGRITWILSTVAVLIITYNGFLITAAGSDDDTLSKAKDAIKWALIGLVGLNFVYIVVKTVISLPY